MTELNKTKSKSKVSKIYNCTVLGIYALVLLAYIVFKLMGNDIKADDIFINAVLQSLLFALVGLIFIPKNTLTWINIILPVVINLPYFLGIVAVTHALDIMGIASYYFEQVIKSPINLIKAFF
ncbi:hypothetical protein [uncultured Fenollaria sp.]|uniref:hypothetical protein n=1 Tax=uncultured Fenollaria sp. TaxID=1686315 RepID=UPI0025D69CB2|nr:hypothetical protein [uncultured Fenollaria sp.]